MKKKLGGKRKGNNTRQRAIYDSLSSVYQRDGHLLDFGGSDLDKTTVMYSRVHCAHSLNEKLNSFRAKYASTY
jgi:hypothetical protein